MSLTDEQRRKRKIKAIYRHWLKDEAFFSDVMGPVQEYSDTAEILRNLGTAIAYAQALAKSPMST